MRRCVPEGRDAYPRPGGGPGGRGGAGGRGGGGGQLLVEVGLRDGGASKTVVVRSPLVLRNMLTMPVQVPARASRGAGTRAEPGGEPGQGRR